jgi:hypothetical protein
MFYKILKSALISFIFLFSSNTFAALVNLIDQGYGFTLDKENYNLKWLNLDIVDTVTYNEVESITSSNDSFFKIATTSQIMELVSSMFSNYDLIYDTDSISFSETVDSRNGDTKSSFIDAFDIMGGRLRTYDGGFFQSVRFSAFFDSGDEDSIGLFSLFGHDYCDGVCSGDAMYVGIIRDKEYAASLRDRNVLHDSVLLVGEIRIVSAPHSFGLLMLGLFFCATRRII